MKITKKARIVAAEEPIDDDMFISAEDPEDGLGDAIGDIADTVGDIQEQIDDIKEDDTEIEMDNNIADHYIAECDRCHGIFISAVIASDQKVETIQGECPLCGKETEQYLKWIIKTADSDEV